jgi:hypothetical protein
MVARLKHAGAETRAVYIARFSKSTKRKCYTAVYLDVLNDTIYSVVSMACGTTETQHQTLALARSVIVYYTAVSGRLFSLCSLLPLRFLVDG